MFFKTVCQTLLGAIWLSGERKSFGHLWYRKIYAWATERVSKRTLSPLCCVSHCLWSEGIARTSEFIAATFLCFAEPLIRILWNWNHSISYFISMTFRDLLAHIWFCHLIFEGGFDSQLNLCVNCNLILIIIKKKFFYHGMNKELVPIHSSEDCFVSNTKWNGDSCATTVSELPLAWAVCKPHQVKK